MNQKTISLAIGSIAVIAVIAFAIFGDLKGLEHIQNGEEVTGAVAMVNGEEITGSEFNTRIEQTEVLLEQQGQSAQLEDPTVRTQLEQQILDQMITEALFLQDAEEQGITVTTEEVDQQVAALVEQIGGQESFDAEIDRQGITEESLRSDIEEQLITQKYLEANIDISSIEITEAEISAFYDEVAAQQEGVPPLAEVEEQIRQQLIQQEQVELVNAYAQQLRADAEIEVLL